MFQVAPRFTDKEVEVAEIVVRLKDRDIHPDGFFDRGGRWFPFKETASLREVRAPSKPYPFSYLRHCRTAKYQAQLHGVDLGNVKKAMKEVRKLNSYLNTH